MAKRRLVLNEADEVAIRMYGQGFGDCFLLALPRAAKDGEAPDKSNPVYVVIDCGLFFRTPRQKDRMVQVTKSIKGATGGVIDLLVATHEHYDHLCGFEDAKEDWKEIEVRQIWLAWTEDSNNPFAKRYNREKEALGFQLTNALKIAEFYAQQDDSLMASVQRALTVADFGGESFPTLSAADDELPDDEVSLPADHPFRVPSNVSKLPNRVLGDFAAKPAERFAEGEVATTTTFCEPGQVLRLPECDVDAYVLGPPTDPAFLGLSFKEDEVYADKTTAARLRAEAIQGATSLAFKSAQAAQEGFALALQRYAGTVVEGKDEEKPDAGAPFGSTYGVQFQEARADEEGFFCRRYFSLPPELQITTDWLLGAGRLALQLDELTNNTSLVLAFRLPDGRFLLFVGDAQVGNWLSWHTIEPDMWRRPEGGAVVFRPTAQEILANTIVYKVGHHGSHNATLATNGLEMMGDDFIAFVPSSRKLPQTEQKHGPWMIPFEPLMKRLKEKTRERVILPHEAPDTPFAGMQIETAGSDLPAMRRDDKIVESAVPLWRQVRIQGAAV